MNHRVLWVAAGLVAVFAGTGCKRKVECHAWRTPEGDISKDDLFRIQELCAKGEDPCPDLSSPRVVVSADGVSLGGVVATPAADIPTSGVKRVDKLFQALKMDREVWKMTHPAETFAPKTDVTLPADIGFSPATSILRTIAFAGYPDVTVHVGSRTLAMKQWVPGPPPASPEQDKQSIFMATRQKDGKVVVQLQRLSARSDFTWKVETGNPTAVKAPPSPFDEAKPEAAAEPPQTLADIAAIQAHLGQVCGGRGKSCVDAIAVRAEDPSFAVVVELAQAVLSAPALAANPPRVILSAD